jgi:hypothetical protein
MITDNKTRPPERAGPSKTSAGRIASLSEAALDLAANGWAVFPCRHTGPAAKAPMTKNGHLDASRNQDQIETWWKQSPYAMIGAPVPDSLLVIDIDPRNGGSVDALEPLVGELPPTLTAWSGRNDGGRHLYFLRPFGPLTSTRLPEGIDLKVNGYCIVPPSIHPATGQPYRWEECEPTTLPSRLQELLRPPPQPIRTYRSGGAGSSAGLIRTVADAPERQRNKVLFWASCRAAENGFIDQIADELISTAVSNGLPELEARRTVASARGKAS